MVLVTLLRDSHVSFRYMPLGTSSLAGSSADGGATSLLWLLIDCDSMQQHNSKQHCPLWSMLKLYSSQLSNRQDKKVVAASQMIKLHFLVCQWWGAGMVISLAWGADLHIAQQMPLLLTISCSSKSRMVLPEWFYFSGAGLPRLSWKKGH